MNNTELDRLLDTWEAPAPPRTLRTGLRDRFPRTQPRRFWRPLRWALVIAVASATLAVGTEQGSGRPFDWLFERLRGWYIALRFGAETEQAAIVRNLVRAYHPKVYVDGQLAGPITYKGGATMWLEVPGAGVYVVSTFPERNWLKAGHVHDNILEFQADGHQVRIVCDMPVVDSDLPVYVTRMP